MHGLYRWHLPDPIYFQSSLRVTLQRIGAWDFRLFERQDDIATTAYWYQSMPRASFPRIPTCPRTAATLATTQACTRGTPVGVARPLAKVATDRAPILVNRPSQRRDEPDGLATPVGLEATPQLSPVRETDPIPRD